MKVTTVASGIARYAWARCRGRPLWSGVSLLVTLRCNLQCPYCDFPRHAGPEMDTDTVVRLLEGLRRGGTFRLGLSGGDPWCATTSGPSRGPRPGWGSSRTSSPTGS